jgi:hypothetical protein
MRIEIADQKLSAPRRKESNDVQCYRHVSSDVDNGFVPGAYPGRPQRSSLCGEAAAEADGSPGNSQQ